MNINIPEEVYDQIMHWVCKVDYEISGFCKVTYDAEDNEFHIKSAHLLKQEGTGGTTDIDAGSLAKLMYTTKDMPGHLRLWWHSHVMMDAFWSGTDRATIEELGSKGWATAIVFNQKHEYRAAYCGKVQRATGQETTEFVDEIEMDIVYPNYREEIVRTWNAEFDANVSRKSYAAYQSTFPSLTNEKVGDKVWDRDDIYGDMYGGDDYWNRRKAERHKEERDPALAMEAAACGMTYDDYVEAITDGDPNVLAELDSKLVKYWNAESGIIDLSRNKVKVIHGSNK